MRMTENTKPYFVRLTSNLFATSPQFILQEYYTWYLHASKNMAGTTFSVYILLHANIMITHPHWHSDAHHWQCVQEDTCEKNTAPGYHISYTGWPNKHQTGFFKKQETATKSIRFQTIATSSSTSISVPQRDHPHYCMRWVIIICRIVWSMNSMFRCDTFQRV